MPANMVYQWEQLASMFAQLGKAAKQMDDGVTERNIELLEMATVAVQQHTGSDEVIPLAFPEPN